MAQGKTLSICILLIGCIFLSSCSGTSRVELERSILDTVLSGYNKDLRPPGENATDVSVNTYVREILSVCEKSHQWKVQLTFRQEWNDARLVYSTEGNPDYHFLTLSSRKDIWTPDLFFSGEIEANLHQVPQSNVFVRIYPNGHVLYSIRITLTLTCPGTGSAAGELVCPLSIASYAYTTEEVALSWKETDPVQVPATRIVLNEFTLGQVTTAATESQTVAGKFSKLLASFHLSRNRCTA
ncbi:unnamed protein product [Orchesella dallaii]|uniref:Neurotransmitter-gated ion-channel ligand-binding domain-containing protein n=1 Tax=Orchesella dallaii TaxID=48710 RepID=A0ABP1RFR9_9HEXA